MLHSNECRYININPSKNRIPPWLLRCTCQTRKCHYNARFNLATPCII